MIGFFKKLLGKKEQNDHPSVVTRPVDDKDRLSPEKTPIQPAKTVTTQISPLSDTEGRDVITISLKSVVSNLPENLKQVVVKNPPGDLVVKFSAGRILPQLSTGAVKVTFRELKNSSPEGFFATDPSLDNEIVFLPLDQIVLQAMPLLKRKPTQKVVEVADDIPDVFGPRGKIIIDEKPPTNGEKKEATLSEKVITPVPPETHTTAEKTVEIKKEEIVEPGRPPDLIESPVQMQPSPIPDMENSISIEIKALSAGWGPDLRKKFDEYRILERKVFIPLCELEPQMKRGKVEFPWQKICQWIVPQPSKELLSPDTVLELPLPVLAPLFLERIRKPKPQKKVTVEEEIPDLFKPETQAGKVKPVTKPTIAETIRLVQEKQNIKPQISEEPAAKEEKPPTIPISIKQPEQIRKPEMVLTPGYGGQDLIKPPEKPAEQLPVTVKPTTGKPRSLGEVFNKPDKPMWAPNEIIQNTLSLPGVTGAMIVLKDGLPVVAKLPPVIKPENLAAFIPEMFNKLSQYTDDLKFGLIKNVSVTCEDFSVRACKSGNIYFVVIGDKENPLPPIETLQFIADEFTKPLRR